MKRYNADFWCGYAVGFFVGLFPIFALMVLR